MSRNHKIPLPSSIDRIRPTMAGRKSAAALYLGDKQLLEDLFCLSLSLSLFQFGGLNAFEVLHRFLTGVPAEAHSRDCFPGFSFHALLSSFSVLLADPRP